MPTPVSPREPTEDQLSNEVAIQVQQFLDEWHYRLMNANMALTWDRDTCLIKAFELFEACGMVLSQQDKEALCQMEEDDMTMELVRKMPVALRKSIGHFLLNVQLVLSTVTRIRLCLDEGTDADIAKVMEDGDAGICQQILKKVVLEASQEVAQFKSLKGSWAKTMDSRINRLSKSAGNAEVATGELERVEAQIRDFKMSQNTKAKSVLVSLASGQDKALKTMCFSSWQTLLEKSKDEREIHKKFQAEIEAAQQKLMEYKQSNMDNVRAMMLKKAIGGDSALISTIVGLWSKAAKDQKKEAEHNRKMAEADARMNQLKAGAKESAKKSLARLSAGSDSALIAMSWESWTTVVQEEKKARAKEAEAQAVKSQLDQMMEKKRAEAKSVLQRMTGASDSGLIFMTFSAWLEDYSAERKARELERMMKANQEQFSMLKSRQKGAASGNAMRASELVDLNVVMQIFMNWASEVQVAKVVEHYGGKLNGKKEKLQAVHSMFKRFADQLETGVDAAPEKEHRSKHKTRTASRTREQAP